MSVRNLRNPKNDKIVAIFRNITIQANECGQNSPPVQCHSSTGCMMHLEEIPQMPEPTIAQKGPYPVEVEAGKSYSWCACGLSANQPFCDGSHRGSGFTPVKFEATEIEDRLSLRLQAHRQSTLLRRQPL